MLALAPVRQDHVPLKVAQREDVQSRLSEQVHGHHASEAVPDQMDLMDAESVESGPDHGGVRPDIAGEP
jgi:hypothetical protein